MFSHNFFAVSIVAGLAISSTAIAGVDLQTQVGMGNFEKSDTEFDETKISVSPQYNRKIGPWRFGMGPYYQYVSMSSDKLNNSSGDVSLYTHELGLDAMVGYNYKPVILYSRIKLSVYSSGAVEGKFGSAPAIEIEMEGDIKRSRREIGVGTMFPLTKKLKATFEFSLSRGTMTSENIIMRGQYFGDEAEAFRQKGEPTNWQIEEKNSSSESWSGKSLSLGLSYELK